MCCECLREWTSYKKECEDEDKDKDEDEDEDKDKDEDEDEDKGGVGMLCMWYLTNHFIFYLPGRSYG